MAEDQEIQCAWNGCSAKFLWKKSEQEFYEKMQFKAPRFCATHRIEAKKLRQEKERKSGSVFNPENIPGHERYRGTNDREMLGL